MNVLIVRVLKAFA